MLTPFRSSREVLIYIIQIIGEDCLACQRMYTVVVLDNYFILFIHQGGELVDLYGPLFVPADALIFPFCIGLPVLFSGSCFVVRK